MLSLNSPPSLCMIWGTGIEDPLGSLERKPVELLFVSINVAQSDLRGSWPSQAKRIARIALTMTQINIEASSATLR